ncbi:MAG: hypothetical protein IIB60_06350 [Planctomycetes bacterium]|nr:hypothetical protein [Planctomycetota bacterium]
MTVAPICLRLLATLLLPAVCVLLCLGFWFSTSEWNATVFGRYTLKWFIGSLVANGVIVLCTWACLRAVWRARAAASANTGSLRTGRFSFRKRFLFGVVVFVALLVPMEVVLRYLDLPASAPGDTLGADISTTYHGFLQQTERIERDGRLVRSYRGKVYDPTTSAEFRIVCLGGSTTWGHHLAPEQTWPAALEATMQSRGYDTEIINAARPWYTTAHSIVSYCLQMRHFDPDVVIVMHGINDLARSFPQPGEPNVEPDYGSYQGPMHRVIHSYKNPAESEFRHLVTLLESSALYRTASSVCDFICRETALDRRFYSVWRTARTAPNIPYRGEIDAGLEVFPTIACYRSNLEYLTRLCLGDGRMVLLSTQAHIYQNDESLEPTGRRDSHRKTLLLNADRIPVSRSGTRKALLAIRKRTLDVAQRLGVPVADPERALGARLDYFIDDLHLSVSGNAAAADAIAETLGPMLCALRDARSPPVASPESIQTAWATHLLP